MDNFDSGELAANQRKPSASNMEIAYSISDDFVVAFGIQNSVDMAGYLPESRALLGFSYALDEKTGLGVEFAGDNDYGTADGGTGNSSASLTVQLATEF